MRSDIKLLAVWLEGRGNQNNKLCAYSILLLPGIRPSLHEALPLGRVLSEVIYIQLIVQTESIA